MAGIYLKKAELSDLITINRIIEEAKAKLKADGSSQWQDGHPNADQIRQDIEQGVGYVLMVGGQVEGYAALILSPDPCYAEIFEGSWQNTQDLYMVIHRVAISSAFRGQHLSTFMMSNLISVCLQNGIKNVRLDTFRLNKVLQHLATKFDFQYRGKIKVEDQIDPWRLAYELNL